MAWTSPRTWVANVTAITALALNTDLRDNLNYLKGLLDGTGSGNVTVPDSLFIDNDANFALSFPGAGLPQITFDTGSDYLRYSRATNQVIFAIGGALPLFFDATGKLSGTGFYASGAASLASAGTASLTHGLGARPRFVWGWFNTTSLAAAADTSSTANFTIRDDQTPGTTVYWFDCTNTTLRITNNTGVTAYYTVYAML